MMFTLEKKQGQWRIDSVKNRYVGEQSWDKVIL
jgi:hypothetical protein